MEKLRIHTCWIVLSSILLFTQCTPENSLDCTKFHGKTERETRVVASFERIEIYDKIDVVIRQDSISEVIVEYSRSLLQEIDVEVKEGALQLRNYESCRFVRSQSKRPTVYITTPRLTSISQYGTGTVRGDGLIVSETLDVDAWAGGERIILNVATRKLLARIHSGSCDLTIGGTTGELFLYQRGQGFAYLQDLQTGFAVVDHEGTGDAHLHIRDNLDYTLGFKGNLYVSGNPEIGQAIITGEGRFYWAN